MYTTPDLSLKVPNSQTAQLTGIELIVHKQALEGSSVGEAHVPFPAPPPLEKLAGVGGPIFRLGLSQALEFPIREFALIRGFGGPILIGALPHFHASNKLALIVVSVNLDRAALPVLLIVDPVPFIPLSRGFYVLPESVPLAV